MHVVRFVAHAEQDRSAEVTPAPVARSRGEDARAARAAARVRWRYGAGASANCTRANVSSVPCQIATAGPVAATASDGVDTTGLVVEMTERRVSAPPGMRS